MCNLYSLTKGQEAIRRIFATARDSVGNLPLLPEVFPDQIAPVIRLDGGQRELLNMRWGMPCPPQYAGRPVTNIRNTNSPHWRAWLKPEFRCLVPVTSFCEWTDTQPKEKRWFALDDSEPLFAFAGIWCRWTGPRGPVKARVEGEHLLFGFLTTEPNDVVRPIHAKAMPVLLTDEDEWRAWLTAPVDEALRLQRPLPTEIMRIVEPPANESKELVPLLI